jgi:hypothetical protein
LGRIIPRGGPLPPLPRRILKIKPMKNQPYFNRLPCDKCRILDLHVLGYFLAFTNPNNVALRARRIAFI